MSLLLFSAAAAALATAQPAASPATQLLDALRVQLTDSYYPAPGVDVAAVMEEAGHRLSVLCEPQGQACSLETGLEAARAAVSALGDRHTVIVRAPVGLPPPGGALRANGATGGPPVQRLPLGWLTRTVRGHNHTYVAWVDPEGPAGRAGVRRFDRVVAPAGADAATLNNPAAPLRVVIERQDRTFEVELVPDGERGGAVPTLTRIGDVAVLQFPSGAGEGVAQAGHLLVAEAQRDGAGSLVLDLRDNGGGGLQCAAMAGAVTDYDAVMRDRRGEETVVSVRRDGVAMGPPASPAPVLRLERPVRWSGPVAVLVNETTASCAESMAIQIERSGLGFVVGEPSYGVGNNTVRLLPLVDGWAIQMTTSFTEDRSGNRLPPRPPLALEVEDDPVAIGRSGRDSVLEAALIRLSAGG